MAKPILQPDKLAKLAAILATLKEDTVSSSQLAALLAPMIATVQRAIAESNVAAESSRQTAAEAQETFQAGLLDLQALLDASNAKLTANAQSVLDKAQAALNQISAIEVKDGQDGDDGAPGAPGKDGSPDTAEQIWEKLNSLPEDYQFDAKRITGLPEPRSYHVFGGSTSRVVTVEDEGTIISKLLRSLNFVGAGVEATSDQSGNITITIPGGSSNLTAADEDATDSGDHTAFTISHTPVTNTLLVINENTGQAVPSNAYTNTTTSIIFKASQQVDDGTGNLITPTFRARYFH
jgi:hypothetical protein